MYKIGGIFLINREEFIKRNVASLYELKDIKVFDLKDLEIAFAKFKLLNKNIDYDSLFDKKKDLRLRFHQRKTVKLTVSGIRQGYRRFLWGDKPRSGKTFIAGGLIAELHLNNILITTCVPKETISQFAELFHSYNDFKDYKIIVFSTGEDMVSTEYGEKNIFVVSKQLLQQNLNGLFANRKMDIIFFE